MGAMRDPLQFTRRDFGKLALAGLPLSLAFAQINSKFKGVQIGAITYSFRTMPNPEDIIKAYVTIGLGEMELMSGDAEKLAGAPIPMTGRGGGRGPGGPPALRQRKHLPQADRPLVARPPLPALPRRVVWRRALHRDARAVDAGR